MLLIGLAILALIIWALFLCSEFEQDNHLMNDELNNKKRSLKRLSSSQEKWLHYCVTIAIISLPLSYVFYQHITQEEIKSSDWSVIAYTLLILFTTLGIHSYLFPIVQERFLWRWGKRYSNYMSKNHKAPKQLKLKL
jgi:hypothetical protein